MREQGTQDSLSMKPKTVLSPRGRNVGKGTSAPREGGGTLLPHRGKWGGGAVGVQPGRPVQGEKPEREKQAAGTGKEATFQ